MSAKKVFWLAVEECLGFLLSGCYVDLLKFRQKEFLVTL